MNDAELQSVYAYYCWVINDPTASKKLKSNLEELLAGIHESRIDKAIRWRRTPLAIRTGNDIH